MKKKKEEVQETCGGGWANGALMVAVKGKMKEGKNKERSSRDLTPNGAFDGGCEREKEFNAKRCIFVLVKRCVLD